MAQVEYSCDAALRQACRDRREAARQQWARIKSDVDSGCCDMEGHPGYHTMRDQELERHLKTKQRLLYNVYSLDFDYSRILAQLHELYLEQRRRRDQGTASTAEQTVAGAHQQQERLPQQVPHTAGSAWFQQVRHGGPLTSATAPPPACFPRPAT